mgnify:CR=1 FL=1
MAASSGEGEQAKGGERQDVASALSTMDGRLARYPIAQRAKPQELPMQRQRAVYLYNRTRPF